MSCTITQGFGANANPSYAGIGLKGHTAVDETCGYNSEVFPKKKIRVYKILDAQRRANDGSGFTGVFGIDEDGNEWLYGHCNPTAKIGQYYDTHEPIGRESNNGRVYSGSTLITLVMQKAGDIRGHHTHVQKRLCVRSKTAVYPKRYLTAFGGGLFKDKEGYYYEIPNYNNGYHGCVDWRQLKASDRLFALAAEGRNAAIYRRVAQVLKSIGL